MLIAFPRNVFNAPFTVNFAQVLAIVSHAKVVTIIMMENVGAHVHQVNRL